MFDSILTSTLTPVNFFVCLGVAMILGLIVALTHQKTARSSANFTTTLAVLPMLVAMAIMLVNGNLGAGVATVGVFSLVRFRSIAGNSRSVLSVFFAMAIYHLCRTLYPLDFARALRPESNPLWRGYSRATAQDHSARRFRLY